MTRLKQYMMGDQKEQICSQIFRFLNDPIVCVPRPFLFPAVLTTFVRRNVPLLFAQQRTSN